MVFCVQDQFSVTGLLQAQGTQRLVGWATPDVSVRIEMAAMARAGETLRNELDLAAQVGADQAECSKCVSVAQNDSLRIGNDCPGYRGEVIRCSQVEDRLWDEIWLVAQEAEQASQSQQPAHCQQAFPCQFSEIFTR